MAKAEFSRRHLLKLGVTAAGATLAPACRSIGVVLGCAPLSTVGH